MGRDAHRLRSWYTAVFSVAKQLTLLVGSLWGAAVRRGITVSLEMYGSFVQIACWVWSSFDHTKQNCSIKRMNIFWSRIYIQWIYVSSSNELELSAFWNSFNRSWTVKEYIHTATVEWLSSLEDRLKSRCKCDSTLKTFNHGINSMVDTLLSFLPSDTVQKLSDLYERCDHEKAEIVGLPGRRSLSPRMTHSRAPVLSCAHYVLPSASYGG